MADYFSSNACYICRQCGAILIPPATMNHNEHIDYQKKSGWINKGPDKATGVPFHYVCGVCNKETAVPTPPPVTATPPATEASPTVIALPVILDFS